MAFVGRWARMDSRSSGVERTFWAAQEGPLQVCWGMCCWGCSVVIGCGCDDGLRLVMCEVSLGKGS